uniref:Uncharacterized protein n=1 Tax=Siphoviridae sp. ctu3K14 TaxID=2826500 RepID=A0A8S5N980_9CAUD|nr:MAG TPA: hypothetical protein [Siphoviridae sp. ctu3K14]
MNEKSLCTIIVQRLLYLYPNHFLDVRKMTLFSWCGNTGL